MPSVQDFTRPIWWPVLALASGLLLPGASLAGLAEPADSVLRDSAALGGTTLTRTPHANFEVSEITTGYGATVREYVSAEGIVFATSWSGPALPDMKVVLGTRYPAYTAHVQAQSTANKVLSMNTHDLVLRVVKLPRGLAGSAHVPALLPPGISGEDIR